MTALALACTALGLVSGVAVLLRTRDPRLSLGVLLEFLLAAGLLRLTVAQAWTDLLLAAAVVLVRRLLVVGLSRSGPGR